MHVVGDLDDKAKLMSLANLWFLLDGEDIRSVGNEAESANEKKYQFGKWQIESMLFWGHGKVFAEG